MSELDLVLYLQPDFDNQECYFIRGVAPQQVRDKFAKAELTPPGTGLLRLIPKMITFGVYHAVSVAGRSRGLSHLLLEQEVVTPEA